MLDFLTVSVPDQFDSHWTRVHSTAEDILLANPGIMSYWISIRRDSLYRKLSSLNCNSVEQIRTKIFAKTLDESKRDIEEIYRFIRTSIHLIVSNNACSSSYYARTKQNDNKTIMIFLNSRLLYSNSNAFVFVAVAVLFREISRALWPECLKNTRSTQFLLNPLFHSWSGIPEKLWPNKRKQTIVWSNKRKQIMQNSKHFLITYVTCPANSQTNLVADAGNLFQHIFYNGEVHLYDDETDHYNEQNLVEVVLRVHQTSSSLCAARYIHVKILDDFFNTNQYSLEIIRKIEDQACPYFKYYPIEWNESRIDDIVLDDRPDDQRIHDFTDSFSNSRLSYQFKPYRPKEPRQHYEQAVFIGYPYGRFSKCVCIFEHVIRTDDIFFLENRWLFRPSALQSSTDSSDRMQKTDSTLSQVKQKPVKINIWIRSLRRLHTCYKNFILNISLAINGKNN